MTHARLGSRNPPPLRRRVVPLRWGHMTEATHESAALTVGEDGRWCARVAVTKADDAQMRIFGIALRATTDAEGTPAVDHQQHVITPDDMAEAAFGWAANGGKSGVYHKPTDPGFVDSAGHMIASAPLTAELRAAWELPPGPATWIVGIQITDPAVWRRYQSGELRELSIRGSAVLEEVAA